MSFDISTLEPQIQNILSAPGTDLQTISAKRVRKMLLELEPSLTAEVLREHKAELDAVIATVFQSVSAEAGLGEASEEPKRKRDDRRVKEEEVVDEDEDDDAPSPPPKKARKAAKKELSDAELARHLSSQINGRTRRSGVANGSSTKKSNRKMKKSADFIESDDSDADDEGGAKKKRKSSGRATGGRAKGGFAKEYLLSPSLAAVLDFSQLSRPQVVKHLWDYIKGHQLQNPRNKKEIMCDDGLRAVFGCDKIDMFKMNKVLGMHLHEMDE